MKRRQRRPVLTLNKPQSNSHVDYTQNRCKLLNNVQPTQSEVNNPLANLCQYNSDSDTEDPKKDVQKLDDQVNDFLKEIQLIAPEQSVPNAVVHPSLATKTTSQSAHSTSQQTLWQECIDRDSGYPYYWHTETNETTWEMPEELRLIKKQSEMGSGTKHSVQGNRWMDFSSITYRQSQTNIPEGMIPQEVVARNRNRFMHNEAPKKSNSEVKTETKKESPAKDDDSDDGRIEMITSFGSDGSDSEDEDNSSDEKKTSLSRSSDSGNASFTSYSSSGEIGPVFCPTQGVQSLGASQSRSYKSDLVSNSTNKSDERKTKSDNKNNAEDTNKNKKDGRAYNEVPKLELNVSLVPGYGDDSDGEEEVKPKQEVKPLFPISQNEEEYANPTNSLKNTHSSSFAKSSDVTASDQCNDGNEDIQETKTSREKIAEEKDSKADVEEKSKANIFLEDMQQVCGKAFQRKRRIAFDVTSAKKQNNVYHDGAVQDDNSSDLASSETSRNTEDSDAGTQSTSCAENKKERDETTKETEQCVGVVSEEKPGSKEELRDTESPAEPKPADVEEKDNEEMTELSQIVTEKLKFLSEGRESVSAVQTMQIQLQTLSTAWAAGSLEDSYFQKWLTSTNHELERLEEDVAPDGWLCQWDRSHKRYYYHNTSTGTSQWTYPDTGIAGGTEEMELCTTPPPESEELSVTELPGTNKTKEKEAADETGGNKTSEENTSDGQPVEQQAPPSQMSANSSSSSPSRIFATDMKSKKKRDRSDDKSLDVKRKRLDRSAIPGAMQAVNPAFESLPYVQATVSPQTLPPNMEPLPPGVDLSDTSYEAATLKGIIYSAASQQGNAIYAPSIGNPTIPILGHQAGLLQESFVPYPFQHLQGAIAIANKHSGQGAVQLMVGYAPTTYTNKVITKPPEIIKASKESFKSALDSFYNDIACIEKPKQVAQHQDVAAAATTSVMEQTPVPTEETKPEIVESETMPNDTTTKERKKKKARITNKKHKEVSTMVAKWQKVQKNLENTV